MFFWRRTQSNEQDNYFLYFYEYWHCNFFEKQDDEKAAEKFKEATEAYEVLSDEKQRELYDMYGHAGVDPNLNMNQQNGNPFGGGGNPFIPTSTPGSGGFF